MSGLADYGSQAVLNWQTGHAAMPTLGANSRWLGLFTTMPTSDAGTGGTEVSGGAYARVQIAGQVATNNTTASGNAVLNFASVPAWIVAGMTVTDLTAPSVIPAGTTVLSKTGTTVTMSANATGGGVGNGDTINFSMFPAATASSGTQPNVTPATVTNGGVITFPQATANWGTVVGFGIFDASSSGNLISYDWLGNYAWLPCTVSAASPAVVTAKAHGYSAADPVVYTLEYGGTSPTFSQSNFTGILAVVSPATDTFTVTNSATAVNTSATGSGSVRKIVQQSIPQNVTASFAASTLTLTAT